MESADWSEIERFVEIGSTLNGKYRIERLLGVGGMGAVVAAEHLKLGESVAIKFLLPHTVGQGRRTQRFLREARAASRIRSAHVARVFDADVRADGAPFIVMEYLTGETLGARLKREGPLEIARTVDDLLEACEAVAEAHSRGVVHRDLKPANLFLARGAGNIGLIKVLDFGISKLVGPDSNESEATTGEGFVGSPPYMSPEQLTDPARIDHRTDIWSLGVILYECLTGKAPFKAVGVGQVLASILQGRPPDVSELRPEVPTGLVKIIERCLTKERDARYPDIVSLARDLAHHGTERGRRALTVIEAVAAGQPAGPPPVRTSDLSPTLTGPGLDTGTLSAAADGLGPRSTRRRPTSGSRVAILFVAIGAIAGVIVLMQRLRVSEADSGGAASADGAVAPPEAVAPRALPTASMAVAAPETSSAPVASAKPKTRKNQAQSVAPAASASSRGFDPVFDERR